MVSLYTLGQRHSCVILVVVGVQFVCLVCSMGVLHGINLSLSLSFSYSLAFPPFPPLPPPTPQMHQLHRVKLLPLIQIQQLVSQ